MNIKKIIAVMLLVFVTTATTLAFYDLYLYNVYIVNRYLRNPSPNPQVQVVIVTIPPGAGSDPRIGFEPAVISIIVGVNNTVVWVNRDSSWHTAHSNIPEFYSNYIQPGSNFTHTFQDPGIYPYHCDPHPWMIGKITVYPATTGNGNAGNVKLTAAHSLAFEAGDCERNRLSSRQCYHVPVGVVSTNKNLYEGRSSGR